MASFVYMNGFHDISLAAAAMQMDIIIYLKLCASLRRQKPNAVSMLAQRRRRWANIETALWSPTIATDRYYMIQEDLNHNTRHSLSVDTMLAQRLRRWTNVVQALGERPVFTQ